MGIILLLLLTSEELWAGLAEMDLNKVWCSQQRRRTDHPTAIHQNLGQPPYTSRYGRNTTGEIYKIWTTGKSINVWLVRRCLRNLLIR